MKAELKENLDKVIELFLLWGADEIAFRKGEEKESISVEESDHRINLFYETIKSGDPDVLRELIGMLTMKVGSGGDFLYESLSQQIFNCYPKEQIADAVFEKFDAIYDSEEWENKVVVEGVFADICSTLWGYDSSKEGFQVFRKLFNKTKPRHAERFLNKMEACKSKYQQPMIATLREDMKKWGDKSATEE